MTVNHAMCPHLMLLHMILYLPIECICHSFSPIHQGQMFGILFRTLLGSLTAHDGGSGLESQLFRFQFSINVYCERQ